MRKTKISTLEQYLSELPGKREIYEFDDHTQAHKFGERMRENVAKEQGVDGWYDCEGIAIDISERVVRIRLLAQEPACV